MDEQAEFVLVVDDDAAKLYLVTKHLRKRGIACEEAGTGLEALQKAQARPLAIVLDVSLPDISGFEVCRRLKSSPATASIPIALLSSVLVDSANRIQGLDAGADAYLTSAASGDELAANVQALIRLARAERERSLALANERKARAELAAERDRLQAILGTISEGLLLHDAEARIQFANASALQLLGLTEDEILGRKPSDPRWARFDREGRPLAAEASPAIDAIYTKQPQPEQIVGVARPDGSRVWLSVRTRPLFSTDGRSITGAVTSFSDITARKEIDEERQRLSTLVENSTDFIGVASLGGQMLYLNAAGQKLVGLSGLDEARRMNVLDFFEEESRTFVREQVWPAVLRDGSWIGEQRLRHAGTGNTIPVTRSVFLVRDQQTGQPLALATIIRDMSERKRQEEKTAFLAEATELLASSFDLDGLLRQLAERVVPRFADWCIIDLLEPDGNIRRLATQHVDGEKVRLSEKLHEISQQIAVPPTGSRRGLHAGETEVWTAHSDDDEQFESARQLGMHALVALPLRAREHTFGTIAFASAESNRPFDETDRAFFEEIARRAALALDNTRLYREAQDAVRARDEFLAIATHELRAPLTSLQLRISMMERRATQPGGLREEQAKDGIATIKRQVERFALLVNGLLDIARLRNARFQLDLTSFDLCGLTQEVVNRLSDHARHAGCTISQPACTPLMVRADQMRIEQVLTNLLSNAFKYGAGQPVEVSLRTVGNKVQLAVIDHGMGIAEADQQRIFDRFERAADAFRKQSLGLGLYIVRQIVQAHGGDITVLSRPGEGSTFTAEWPREAQVSPAPSAEMDASAALL